MFEKRNECGKKTCRTRRIMTFHAMATTMKAPTMTNRHNNKIGKYKYTPSYTRKALSEWEQQQLHIQTHDALAYMHTHKQYQKRKRRAKTKNNTRTFTRNEMT